MDVFAFVPYDSWLDQKAIKIEVKSKLEKKESKQLAPEQYLIQCVDPLTKENVLPLYGLALQLAIQMWFEKSHLIPSYEKIYGSIGAEKKFELKEVIHFLNANKSQEMYTEKGMKWPLLVQMANAYRTLSNGLLCQWRQITNYEQWVPQSYLTEMLETCIQLLGKVLLREGITFYKKLVLPIFLYNLQVDVVGNVFLESSDSYIHLNFSQSGVNDTQSSIAYAMSCLHHLNPKTCRQSKATYILSPQAGTLMEVTRQVEENIMEKFLLESISRKLSVARTFIEIAYERIGTPTTRASVRKKKGSVKKKRKSPSSSIPKKNKVTHLQQKLESFYFKKQKNNMDDSVMISCIS